MIKRPATDEDRDALDRAFNLGSDARIYGYAMEDNPYEPKTREFDEWRYGWYHVDTCWNRNNRRYPAKALPDVLRVF